MGANLALMVLIGQLAGPAPFSDIPQLVTQLGAGRFAERQAAAKALEQVGGQALSALRLARHSKDLEVRTRATALIAKIEGALLTQPAMIQLDYADRPLRDVLKQVGAQAGIRLSLYPEQGPGVQERRISVREPQPLPFWKAMDRLCDAAQLQYNFAGMPGNGNSREPVFPLFAGGSRPTGPMSDDGPFRVSLVSFHYERDITFMSGGNPIGFANRGGLPRPVAPTPRSEPGHSFNEQFFAQIQVAAEPRLSVSQSGSIKILEATDEQGQSLLLSGSSGPVVQRYTGYFGLTAASTIQLQAPLKRPEHPGKSIRKLRGLLPVIVASRKPDPLVVPLQNAIGKSFRNEEVSLTIQDVRSNPNSRQTSIEISLRSNESSAPGSTAADHGGDELVGQRPQTHQQQIEVLDSQGRTIPWYHSNDAEGDRMTLTLIPHEQGTPSEIRYYSMSKAVTEVHFAFENVPMP